MIEIINNFQDSLIYKNFFIVLSGLDNTILLLLTTALSTESIIAPLSSNDKSSILCEDSIEEHVGFQY